MCKKMYITICDNLFIEVKNKMRFWFTRREKWIRTGMDF